METRYYEGCGREGPIRCIFLGEFHPVAGPKIACQFPEDFISKDLFDSLSTFIIPKPILQKKNITFNAPAHKILGYPIYLKSPRYPRNVYVFNLCFVCDNWSRTVQYEPVVKKLGEHLITLEEESAFVSGGSSRLPTFLAHLLYDLNTYRKTTVTEGDTIIHVKVTEIRDDPSTVNDHDVPVLVASIGLPRPGNSSNLSEEPDSSSREDLRDELQDQQPMEIYTNSNWDLTTKQLLPYINGYYHVSKIAAKVNVEKTLVKACIQNLVYYGVVNIFVFCFTKTKYTYPTYTRGRSRPATFGSEVKGLQKLFTGERCTDEICCLTSIDIPSLERIIEDDPNVAVIVC
ncbi:Nitrogen permease regulator 2-like protein [Papilio machaon]|uniref:Nitrogen permease regulator 2-like protein n=1 Tax=Papilio machaon TaxID=76193 RepID=A0A194QXV9_PAPMA|nr:Nitrogen permease regulator 2-like protein [Papilio machaon]